MSSGGPALRFSGTREKERRGGEIPGATETKGVIRGTASPQPGENWGCGM